MKKSLVEVLVGLALVAIWMAVAAQADRSQRLGSAVVVGLDGRQMAVVDRQRRLGDAAPTVSRDRAARPSDRSHGAGPSSAPSAAGPRG